MPALGTITGGKDKAGNFKVHPLGRGSTVILRGSSPAPYQRGDPIEYEVVEHGMQVDFADDYKRAQPLSSPQPTIDLVIWDIRSYDIMVVGRWQEGEEQSFLPLRSIISELQPENGYHEGQIGDRRYWTTTGSPGQYIPEMFKVDPKVVVRGRFPSIALAPSAIQNMSSTQHPDRQLLEERIRVELDRLSRLK